MLDVILEMLISTIMEVMEGGAAGLAQVDSLQVSGPG